MLFNVNFLYVRAPFSNFISYQKLLARNFISEQQSVVTRHQLSVNQRGKPKRFSYLLLFGLGVLMLDFWFSRNFQTSFHGSNGSNILFSKWERGLGSGNGTKGSLFLITKEIASLNPWTKKGYYRKNPRAHPN